MGSERFSNFACLSLKAMNSGTKPSVEKVSWMLWIVLFL